MLPHTTSYLSPPVLARPERTTDRLLVWVWEHGSRSGGAAFIETYVSEGWNVLEISSQIPDYETVSVDLTETLKHAHSLIPGAATMFVAERGMASAVCHAATLADRGGLLGNPWGLVTLDAFAEPTFPSLGDRLCELRTHSTIWAAGRENRTLRARTLAHHKTLQARGLESRFIALPELARSLAERLTDSREPLGHDARWLIDPVHSRSA